MLHEPPKTKQYIIIFGAAAAVLAVLAVVAISLLYKSKTTQTPANLPATSQQQKIQKDMNEAAKKLKDQQISEQQIKEDMNTASEEMKKLPSPSPEEMQKAAKKLNQLK